MPDGSSFDSGIDLSWLDQPLPPRGDDEPDPRSAEVLRLSNKADYEQATALAQIILAEQKGDVQVFSRYLFGVFLAQGLAILGKLLDAANRAFAPELDSSNKKAKANADVSLGWLLRTMRDRIQYHQAIKDPVWRKWIDACQPAMIDPMGDACQRLSKMAQQHRASAQIIESIAGLETFVRGSLPSLVPRPAPPKPPPPAPAPPPPPALEPEVDEDEPPVRVAKKVLPNERRTLARPKNPPPVASEMATVPADVDSPAMQELRKKLDAFQVLVRRGDMARAAVVGRDIERIVENFDPRVYLPRLFMPFFKRMATSVGDLSPYWEAEGSPAWRALDQLYRVDIEAFLHEGDDGDE